MFLGFLGEPLRKEKYFESLKNMVAFFIVEKISFHFSLYAVGGRNKGTTSLCMSWLGYTYGPLLSVCRGWDTHMDHFYLYAVNERHIGSHMGTTTSILPLREDTKGPLLSVCRG